MDRGPSGWIGSVLQERWRIDAKIARGGVATVYKGFDLETRTKVAVKIMHPEFSRNQDARGRFMREGYVANKVGHPLVVTVLGDAALPDGTVFLVMELLEHGELLEAKRERLGGQMPAPEVVRIGDQILDVLVAAHNQDIVHRDIKPENLFVLDDGTVKVLDFGIAHLREAATRSGHESTATGLLLGTPDFMSPEQAMGVRGTIDAASDIYAVGATMFTLLSGEAVHTDMSLAALVHSTSSKQARSLATTKVGPSLPAALVAVIDKALMLQKIHRWPSARAMQNALRDAVPSAQPIKGPPESAKTRPFSPIDLKPVASLRSSGKPPRPSVAPRPPTKAPPPPKPPPLEPDLSDIHTTQAMTGELLAALPSVQASLPPPTPRDLGRTGDHPSLPPPPPPRDLGRTGDHPSLPPPPADLYRTGDHPSLPPPGVKATASMPPPPLRGSLPPPPQHPSFPPPPPAHGSLPPPYYSPSQPPPPFVGPSTPRHQGWTTTDSGGVGILQQQAPSIPPPLPTPAPLVTGSDVSRQRKKAAPPKPPSIIIAEIVLALLVVVTLTIGGCLLLQAR